MPAVFPPSAPSRPGLSSAPLSERAPYSDPAPSDPMTPRPSPMSERGGGSGPVSRRMAPTQGLFFRVTKALEARHGAFFISRLILMTGIKLRGFDASSPDDPRLIIKLTGALRAILSDSDFDEIQPVLRDRS